MTKEYVGDACAYIKTPGQDKASYPKIGILFQDSGDGRFSLKLDTLPLPSSGWSGWVNIFPRDQEQKPTRPAKPSAKNGFADFDDDIPF